MVVVRLLLIRIYAAYSTPITKFLINLEAGVEHIELTLQRCTTPKPQTSWSSEAINASGNSKLKECLKSVEQLDMLKRMCSFSKTQPTKWY